jgi:3-hydroxyisobutyrate dehydrogenase-like beta-hydroxyacid dehydrogenase
MDRKIGFLGMGIMGRAMAGNLARAGHEVTVYNRTPLTAEELHLMGVSAAPTPRMLAERADVIIAMVTGPEAVEALLWGPDGAAEAFNGQKIFINMSTVSPRYTRDIAARLAPTSARFIDAPVSGSKKPAEEATLVILAGGPQRDVEESTPLFLTMGKRVVYCGEVGQGSMMKMAVNLLLGAMMEGLCEATAFAASGGLAVDAFLDVVSSGPLQCALFQMKGDMIRQSEFPAQFPLKHITKDLKFVVDTAYEMGAAIPAGQLLLHLYRACVARGLGDMDFAAVLEMLRELGGEH